VSQDRRPTLRLALGCFAGLALAVDSNAQATYHVSGTCGSDAWTGLSSVCQAPDGPKATIQAGLNSATFGDTVVVADGVYTGSGNKNLGFANGVALRSRNGPANCTIDCEEAGRGFMFPGGEGPETVVDGFTVTGGKASAGGAFFCYYNSAPTITNCVITGNTDIGEGGGAIYGTVASPTISNCTIFGNTASAAGGGAIYSIYGDPQIINCTIVGNTTTGSGGAVHASSISNPTITNSILWGNGPDEIYVDAGSTIAVSYSNVQQGWSGTGNMDSDPHFSDLGEGNLRLLGASPCVDTGDNSAVPSDLLLDLDANPRFVDDPNTADAGQGIAPIVDLGAYEFQADRRPRVFSKRKAGTVNVGTVRLP
jgi:hypothetical protein